MSYLTWVDFEPLLLYEAIARLGGSRQNFFEKTKGVIFFCAKIAHNSRQGKSGLVQLGHKFASKPEQSGLYSSIRLEAIYI